MQINKNLQKKNQKNSFEQRDAYEQRNTIKPERYK